MSVLRIRASMLPGYADCARRAVAKQFHRLVEDQGHELRQLMPSVGAAVGTAVHVIAAHVLRNKMEHGIPGVFADGLTTAMEKFSEEIGPGAEWDDTTPNVMAAQSQIARLAMAYLPLTQEITPVAVELELTAEIQPGWELSGHVDLITSDGRVDDLKTGALPRPYQTQLGGYALLARANGHKVSEVGITFIQRVRGSRIQPPPVRQTFDLDTSQREAMATIQAITRDVDAFEETGKPEVIRANPMSLMCSPKYCPAWGTSFCKMHSEKPSAVDAD